MGRVREASKHVDGVGRLHLQSQNSDWVIIVPLDPMRHKKLRSEIESVVNEAASGTPVVFIEAPRGTVR